MNKKKTDFRKKQCVSICAILEKCKSFDLFSINRSNVADGPFKILMMCSVKYVFSQHHLTLHCLIQKKQSLLTFSLFFQSSRWINREINTSHKEPEKFLIGATAVLYM